MPFCEVFGLDRRRFWKNNLYWNYQCLLNAGKYVHESMFCYILQTSCRIRIVLVLFLNQSHVLWFFLPSKYWLAIKLVIRLNVIYIKHVLVKSVSQWLFYYYTNSRALGCVPVLEEGKGLSFKISYLIILQFLVIVRFTSNIT